MQGRFQSRWHGTVAPTNTLSESAGTTTLEFVHHSVNRKAVGELGPGWEFYLDALVASRDGQPPPKFDAYYPAQKAYFTSLEG